MEKINLELSQMLEKHPIREEKDKYKHKYLCFLEYFVKKYSPDEKWAESTLKLYKEILLTETECSCSDNELKKLSKHLFIYKIRKWKFVTYKYCIYIDILFMNAFFNKGRALEILDELKNVYSKRSYNMLTSLTEELYGGNSSGIYSQTEYMLDCWKKNKAFTSSESNNVFIAANMSAGKSTLLNALVGKKVNKTRNEACTAKIHYIFNKAYEDNFNYEWDHDLELNASYNILMDDNENNISDEIAVGTSFRSLNEFKGRMCFIDTPGVNSSQDKDHRQITENAMKNLKYDRILYLMNGQNIGTDDDRRYLGYICDNYKGDIIFIINKLDTFRSKDDSVTETIGRVKKELSEIGFKKPEVYPVSSYAGYLAKLKLSGNAIAMDEEDEYEYERLKRKLSKAQFKFNEYYPENIRDMSENIAQGEDEQLLLHSGILSLECLLFNK